MYCAEKRRQTLVSLRFLASRSFANPDWKGFFLNLKNLSTRRKIFSYNLLPHWQMRSIGKLSSLTVVCIGTDLQTFYCQPIEFSGVYLIQLDHLSDKHASRVYMNVHNGSESERGKHTSVVVSMGVILFRCLVKWVIPFQMKQPHHREYLCNRTHTHRCHRWLSQPCLCRTNMSHARLRRGKAGSLQIQLQRFELQCHARLFKSHSGYRHKATPGTATFCCSLRVCQSA